VFSSFLFEAIKLIILGKHISSYWQKFAVEMPKILLMSLPKLQNNIPKIVAIVAVSSIIPGLALLGTLLGTDKGKGNDGQNNGNQYGKGGGDPVVEAVPEANPGFVLIPFVGAVLIVSSLQVLRFKSRKSGSH
jgi:hypothetical protein